MNCPCLQEVIDLFILLPVLREREISKKKSYALIPLLLDKNGKDRIFILFLYLLERSVANKSSDIVKGCSLMFSL